MVLFTLCIRSYTFDVLCKICNLSISHLVETCIIQLKICRTDTKDVSMNGVYPRSVLWLITIVAHNGMAVII